jgi:O-succinylbenzoate synthase
LTIDAIELREIRLPLVSPFETSGWKEEEKTCIIASLEDGSEIGYGECAVSPGPWFGPETLTTAWHIMEDHILPNVLGKDFDNPQELLNGVSQIRGHNTTKAAFEMALWDLLAKKKKISLSRMIGGTRTRIDSGVSVGVQKNIKQLIEVVSGYVKQGYLRVKLKIKPGWDVKQVGAVRAQFPGLRLMVDANGAYSPENKDTLAQLDQFGLMMIEQPFAWDDMVEHALLQSMIKTPVCLDESVSSLNDMKTALALQSCRVLNIKPARVGGLTVSKNIHDLCLSKKMPVWCGGLLETGIGRAHNVALASLAGFVLPGDISASNRYFKQDIVNPEFVLNNDGTMDVPQDDGIGVEVLADCLEENTTVKKRFSA